MSLQQALEESYSANFGTELDEPEEENNNVDPCPAFMLFHKEPEESEPDP